MPTSVATRQKSTRHNSREHSNEGLVRSSRMFDEPSMSDQRVIRYDIGGNLEIDRIIRNSRRTNWGSYTKHLGANIVQLQVNGDIRSEKEVKTAVERREEMSSAVRLRQ